jgi:hypothetical protein
MQKYASCHYHSSYLYNAPESLYSGFHSSLIRQPFPPNAAVQAVKLNKTPRYRDARGSGSDSGSDLLRSRVLVSCTARRRVFRVLGGLLCSIRWIKVLNLDPFDIHLERKGIILQAAGFVSSAYSRDGGTDSVYQPYHSARFRIEASGVLLLYNYNSRRGTHELYSRSHRII